MKRDEVYSVQLSLILPVHNEATGIVSFTQRTISVLQQLGVGYEIILVENGSTDKSLEFLNDLQSRHNQIRVWQSQLGWGNAVREGIKHVKGQYTCYMVSDGQVEPKYIAQIYRLIMQKPVALVKIWRTGRENILRLVNSLIYNMLARLVLGMDSRDINATPKIIKTDLIKQLELSSTNIGLDLELLLKLRARRLSWLEIPADTQKRQDGHSTTKLKTVFEMLRCMVAFRLGKGISREQAGEDKTGPVETRCGMVL